MTIPMAPRKSGRALSRRTMSSVICVSDESSMSMRTKLPVRGHVRESHGNRLGQWRVEREAHLRQLDADVGVELALGDGVEQAMVDIGCSERLCFGGDALAERIQRDMHALLVDGFGHAEGVFDLHPGDKARTELAADAGVLAEAAEVEDCGRVR